MRCQQQESDLPDASSDAMSPILSWFRASGEINMDYISRFLSHQQSADIIR